MTSTPLVDETLAICTRAHAGLIKARADLFMVDGKKIGAVKIPDVFWWAEGQAALEQNWTTGDFSTWIEQRLHMQAFGVYFGLDGLLGLLPVERRAVAAKSVSIVAKPEWLSANEARRFAYERAGINPNVATVAILDACRLGYARRQIDSALGIAEFTDRTSICVFRTGWPFRVERRRPLRSTVRLNFQPSANAA